MEFLKKYYSRVYDGLKRTKRIKWVFVVILSIPVCIFLYQYLATGNKLITGDFDYYAQMYEAFRISVLKYGQFPSWNPWMAGGLPLYANPQFGLVSIQSILSLIFGAIYGLKLAFIIHALAGFWGMYVLGKKVLKTDTLRSILIAYIWVFCGFFAGHGISHFTFSLFYLLPWLIIFIYNRKDKWAWLWLALIESFIILSSIHYAFLMTGVAVGIYFILNLLSGEFRDKKLILTLKISKSDILFALKFLAVVIVLCGYRFMTTLMYVSANERVVNVERMVTYPDTIFSAIFLPIGTFLKVPKNLDWGWIEYSMYIGMGAGIALLVCIIFIIKRAFWGPKIKSINKMKFVLPIIIIGVLCLVLALGDFGKLSPYHLLHTLPGFTQTRVSSRWLIMTAFAILVFLLAWRTNKKLINILLLLSVIELFLTFGPPRVIGQNQISIPDNTSFSETFTQYDNGRKHLNMREDINNSYYYSTSKNIGQIYADDSMINTLNKVYGTSKCGINKNKDCSLVLSKNATISHWSPNKIVLERESKGEIKLNMNVQDGWRVNNKYIYADAKQLNPKTTFIIPDDNIQTYTLEYAPEFSPSWIIGEIMHKSN